MACKNSEIKIFAGSSGKVFADKVCKYLDIDLGKSYSMTFSEGNTFVKVEETVRDKDVYIIQPVGLSPNDDFMELLFWLDAFKRASANSITLVMPFFSYAKADKKDEPRVSIRARVCADAIEVTGVDRVITMDLHSPQIQGFFKVPVDHLLARPVLCNYIKESKINNFVIAAPDAGFAKDARKYSLDLGVSTVIGAKERKANDEKAEILEIIGDVKGKNVIIVDDFTTSCGTLADMAKGLKNMGAQDIYACVSHGLLQEKGLRVLEKSHIKELIISDSIYNQFTLNHHKVTTISVAPLFAEAIRRIHNRESISTLF
ncbi:ribose-phosphate diphosphokinase [Sporosalibacterium faouarense]|uniref:ribose-phosphate diphosphokinase n=1 Tax=Sporosalibacterium faouarense TaxID=516123 RepID=UPI00192BDB64|nr:ribose-phosphate diphosphokinase [Sporosalibacterium faouarense]